MLITFVIKEIQSMNTSTVSSTDQSKDINYNQDGKIKKTSDSAISFKKFVPGLSNCKQNQDCSIKDSVCYTHVGGGNLAVTTTNKVYILTISHIFTETPSEYMLTDRSQLNIPFNYANPIGLKDDPAIWVPLGEFDPETSQIKLIKTSFSTGKLHVHK